MCNLEKIYALIVLESVAHDEQSLESIENDFQGEIAGRLKRGFRKHRSIMESAYRVVTAARAPSVSDGTSRSREHYALPALEVQ